MSEPHRSTHPYLAAEQSYVDGLFAHLDRDIAAAQQRLADAQLAIDPDSADSDALIRRETEYHQVQDKIDKLNLAQLGLVFGRIDIAADESTIDNPTAEGLDRRYIGRMGLVDRDDDYRSLLIDWRAPMARPFYLATTAHPNGVRRRRHLRTSGRTVTDIDDEILSGDIDSGSSDATDRGVGSETALLHALNRARSGYMSSIVETIQREQDAIIRDSTRGVVVVEGGPGTGKTAVALHRVAYLLYTWRTQLAASGVLIVGPNRTFLDYISHVLPELGETGVVLSTVGELYPGVKTSRVDTLLAREIKGSEEMVHILRQAVRAYQRLPDDEITVTIDALTLHIPPAMVKAARTRARRSRKPHNTARGIFSDHLIEQLAQQMGELIGSDPLGGANLLGRADIDQLHDDLAEDNAVNEIIEDLWPVVTPQQVLEELISDPDAIALAAREYDDETRQALLRGKESGFSTSDIALLDELAVIIGTGDSEQQRRDSDKAWRKAVAEAQDALDILQTSESTDNDDAFDAEVLSAHDVIDAETLARRQQVTDQRTTAERAAEDHTWAYGHVIVDEAQELSPMEWRMIFRRSPSRWMTVVGDPAQTSSPAGSDEWAETLAPFVGTRFRHHRLTINYRTPSEIMELAGRILQRIDPDAQPPAAIRDSGIPVRFLPSGSDPADIEFDDDRLVAIIDAHNADTHKGLEYDHVIVVEPAEIVAASPQGWQDLYVACTRSTQSLTVIGEIDWN